MTCLFVENTFEIFKNASEGLHSSQRNLLQVDKLVAGISGRSSQQQVMLLRLAVAALEHLAEMPHGLEVGDAFRSKYGPLSY